jgi:hypothetical protein
MTRSTRRKQPAQEEASRMSGPDLPEPPVENRYRRLPDRIAVEDMLTEQPATPPPDLDGGRDVAQDAALRAGG